MTIPEGQMLHPQDSLSWQLYGGAIDIEADNSILSMNNVKSLCTSQHIVKLHHDGLSTYRANRNWKHIRESSKYYYDLWFPTRGSVVINQNHQSCELSSDEYAITYANKPFNVTIQTGQGKVFEAYLLSTPAHQMQGYVPNCALLAGRKFSITSGDTRAARQTLINLFEEGNLMSAEVISAYMQASLKALTSSMKEEGKKAYKASTLRAGRLKLICETIESNLSNPKLSAAMVARECRISSRYLYILLRDANLRFSELVWSKRLDCAKKWLQDHNFDDLTISSIAHNCGFTSAPHFSRLFRTRFGLTPTEIRKSRFGLAS